MRDAVQKIIETEGEAKLIVEAARAEADRILSEAQRKGQELVERARYEALAEAEKIEGAARESAERDKQDRLTRAAEEIERQIDIEAATRQWAVEEVVRCVCGQK
jgi:F-type H+-transporting ATPase subunit b